LVKNEGVLIGQRQGVHAKTQRRKGFIATNPARLQVTASGGSKALRSTKFGKLLINNEGVLIGQRQGVHAKTLRRKVFFATNPARPEISRKEWQ